jgi:hypothetical protein
VDDSYVVIDAVSGEIYGRLGSAIADLLPRLMQVGNPSQSSALGSSKFTNVLSLIGAQFIESMPESRKKICD